MLFSIKVADILDPLPGLVSAGEVDGQRMFAVSCDGAVRLLGDRMVEVAHKDV